MAYGKQRVKPTTKFGQWLDLRMRIHDMNALTIAEKLHCSYSTIYYQRSGRQRPTFSDIVAYCWLFGCPDDPETVWQMVDILIEEE